MTTIITIVVVALVFFVTVCVVAFMVWKREAEMRTDSIKAIEYNVEEMLHELTGNSSREIRRSRMKRTDDGDREQDGAQQETNDKIKIVKEDPDSRHEDISEKPQDPFGWMRKESGGEETVSMEETADAETKARANITVFEPAAVQHEPYVRRRRGISERDGRDGLRWVEVYEERRYGKDDDAASEDPRQEKDTAIETSIEDRPWQGTSQTRADRQPSEALDAPPESESHIVMPVPEPVPTTVPEPVSVQPPPVSPELPEAEEKQQGGMISKLLKRRKKQKEQDEQIPVRQQTQHRAYDQGHDWAQARTYDWTYDQVHDQEYDRDQEQIYELYEPMPEPAPPSVPEQEEEWKGKTVEDLLKEYIGEPFEEADEAPFVPEKPGYNVGRSGRKYTVAELETLIKE